MIDFSVPLAGMTQATDQLNQTAAKLAQPSGPQSGGDSLDLSSDMVALMEARQNFEANAKALHTENDLTMSLLNAVG